MREPSLHKDRTIHKITIPITDEVTVHDPGFSEGMVVHVEADPTAPNRLICIWFLVECNENRGEPVTFRVYGTGHTIEAGSKRFLGTVVCPNALVFHVFEEV